MTQLEPFSGLCAEGLEIELLESMRVDRDNELEKCIDALLSRSENLFLYGSRGIGKTFLVRILFEEIKKESENTVPIFVNVFNFLNPIPSEIVSAFPNAILIEICKTIWVDVLGKEYSTLRSEISKTNRKINFRNKGEKKIIDIFRLLMTSNIRMRASQEYSIGTSTILKSDAKESTQREWSEIDILPFEFFEFIEEIKKETLLPKGKERIIVICDEANKLPIFQQAAILDRYIELFAAKQVQFVFVAAPFSKEIGPIPSGFQNIFEVKGFQEKEHIKELIEKHTSSLDVSISGSAIDVVWEIFKGHPVFTINACRNAYIQIDQEKIESIDAKVMAVSCANLLRELEEHRRLRESQSL